MHVQAPQEAQKKKKKTLNQLIPQQPIGRSSRWFFHCGAGSGINLKRKEGRGGIGGVSGGGTTQNEWVMQHRHVEQYSMFKKLLYYCFLRPMSVYGMVRTELSAG